MELQRARAEDGAAVLKTATAVAERQIQQQHAYEHKVLHEKLQADTAVLVEQEYIAEQEAARQREEAAVAVSNAAFQQEVSQREVDAKTQHLERLRVRREQEDELAAEATLLAAS